jgi:hypothetical protein
MAESDIRVTRIIYERDGKEFVARLPTDDEKRAVEAKLQAEGKSMSCTCGEWFCDGSWWWRCMYAGGGVCDWFITYDVC